MPDVPKRSAGYFAAPGMDLIDLFIGAEGTLGVIVEAELRVRPRPAAVCWALIPLTSEPAAIALTAALRDAAADTWRSGDARGIDLSAIEHIDRRSLEVVREDGVDRRLAIAVPPETAVILLAQVELPRRFRGARSVARSRGRDQRRRPRTPRSRGCADCSIATASSATPRSLCPPIVGARRLLWSCARPCRRASTVAWRWRERQTRAFTRPRRT